MLYIARKDGVQFYAQPDSIERLANDGYDILRLVEEPVGDVSAEAQSAVDAIGGSFQAPEPEYRDLRHDLVMEYGTPEKGDDGNETGRYELRFDSPSWPAYEKEITEWAMLEHEPDVYKIPAKSAIGQLTGKEMLDLEWMLEFEDEDA